MNIKKIFIFLVICIALYILTQYIVKKKYVNSIENFSDPAPYSKQCQDKILHDATYYKYSINDLKNVYSLTDKNDNINLYYKNLSDDLGNITINKNITSNLIVNNLLNNSILIPGGNIAKESKVCKKKNTKLFIDKVDDGINIYNFQKINSNIVDIIPTDDKDISSEFSNDYFNKSFLNIISNSTKYIKTFENLTENMNKVLFDIYTRIENVILNKINSLKDLQYNTKVEYNTFVIVKRYINSFLKDTTSKLYTINFEILIHRLHKQHAKHLNIIINYDDSTQIMDIIILKVIGIVVEYDINRMEKKIMDIYDASDYSLIKMSDAETDKYLENHKNNVNINV